MAPGTISLGTIIVSIVLTIVLYSTFPVLTALMRSKPIEHKSYNRICWILNIIALIGDFLLTTYNGGAYKIKFWPFFIWTPLGIWFGKKILNSKGILIDESSGASKTSTGQADKAAYTASPKTQEMRYVCKHCGAYSTGWYQTCPSCGAVGKMEKLSASQIKPANLTTKTIVVTSESTQTATATIPEKQTVVTNRSDRVMFICPKCAHTESEYGSALDKNCPQCGEKLIKTAIAPDMWAKMPDYQKGIVIKTYSRGAPSTSGQEIQAEENENQAATIMREDTASPEKPGPQRVTCSVCGAKILEGAKFCSNCGRKILPPSAMKYCRFCGNKIRESSKFCPECGKPLE